MSNTATAPATRGRAPARIALIVLQVLLGLFMIVASGLPKLWGDATAVQMFTEIGAGQWFRYLVGVLEIAGGVGLLVPRLSGLAALGLVGLMIGAVLTQVFVLAQPFFVITPIVLGLLFALVAWARRGETRALVAR